MNFEMNYPKIEALTEKLFNEYFVDNIKPLKYFYFDEDFFKSHLNLEYRHINFNEDLKKAINECGRSYFENSILCFQINLNSRRNSYEITTYKSLFTNVICSNVMQRKDYIEELVLYHLLLKINSESENELESIVNYQLNNFLVSYIGFVIENVKPNTSPWNQFTPAKYDGKFQKVLEDIKLRVEIQKEIINDLKYNDLEEIGDPVFDDDSEYEFYDYLSKNEKRLYKIPYVKMEGLEKISSKIGRLYIDPSIIKNIHFIYKYPDLSKKDVIKSILDLADLSSDDKLDELTFYRGQSASSWDIQASIVRDKGHLDNEHEMFYDILSLKPNEFEGDNTVYEKLITMQHFELPTRLLDLSRNPLISLYFACSYNFNKDGALYIFQENKENVLHFEDPILDCLTKIVNSRNGKVCSSCLKEDCPAGDDQILGRLNGSCDILKKSYFVKGIAKNQRINNQSGDFIFVGLEEKGNKCKEDIDQKPSKIIILDSSIKKDLLNDLSSLNIHGGTIYPDLTNMSRYIKSSFSVPTKKQFTHEDDINTVVEFLSSLELNSEVVESSGFEEVRGVNDIKLFTNPDSFKQFTIYEINLLKERFISGEIKDVHMLGQEIKSLLSKKDLKLSERRRLTEQAISKVFT